jgi:hypothetical protein
MNSNYAAVGTATVLLLGGSAAGPVTERAAPRSPGAVSATVVSTAGSGCPQGTAAATVQATRDPAVFSIRHPGAVARAGTSTRFPDGRKFCQVRVSVRTAQGWTWTISRVEQSGRAQLASGAVGTARFTYFWTGEAATGSHVKTLHGPNDSAWTVVDTTGVQKVGWAPCGATANLTIKTDVSVRAASGANRTSSLTAGGAGVPASTYRVSFKKC